MQDFFIKIAEALHSNFLSVFIISMFPVVEVRGGIPMGLSIGMEPWAAYLSAICAGAVISPIILILLKKVIMWMCHSKKFGKFGTALNNYFDGKAKDVSDGKIVRFRDSDFFKYLALYLFVAAPLPLTGFWTGSAIAVFMNLKGWKSYIAIMLGNFTAGGLILLISLVMGDKSYIITIIFVILLPLVIALMIYKMVKDKKKRQKELEVSPVAVGEITDNTTDNSEIIGESANIEDNNSTNE